MLVQRSLSTGTASQPHRETMENEVAKERIKATFNRGHIRCVKHLLRVLKSFAATIASVHDNILIPTQNGKNRAAIAASHLQNPRILLPAGNEFGKLLQQVPSLLEELAGVVAGVEAAPGGGDVWRRRRSRRRGGRREREQVVTEGRVGFDVGSEVVPVEVLGEVLRFRLAHFSPLSQTDEEAQGRALLGF